MDRIRFETAEKVLLQNLILKYKIHTKDLNSRDRANKKKAWMQLVQEFNNTNDYNRTKAQLKKYWHNMKTRRLKSCGVAPTQDESSQRSAIARELGLHTASLTEDQDWEPPVEPDNSSSDSDKESQVAEESLGAAASPPRASPGPAGESLRPPKEEDSPASESEASRPSAGAKRRRSSGHSSTLPVVADAPDVDQRAQERIEELHKLKVAEQVWTLKTLRERHATAQLERQRAHDESERAKLLRDAAEYQRERALLQLHQFKQSVDPDHGSQ